MNTNWKSSLLLLALSLSFAASPGVQSKSAQKNDTAGKTESPADKQETDVRAVLIQIEGAVNAGDVARLMSLWSDDGIFIDTCGAQTIGRAALQERFAAAFKQTENRTFGLHPERISLPAGNVALVVGEVSRKSGKVDLPASRFSLVLVKKGDVWLVNEATEVAMQDTKAADHLRELEWLIGKWQVGEADSSAQLDVEWAPGRNFILSKCIIARKGSSEVDSQVIGWDPRTKSIVSWHFDSNGGFGYGKWTRDAAKWIVEFAGVSADGGDTRATNVFTEQSPGEFSWQSTEQSADGVALSDTPVRKVTRTKL